MEWKCKSCKEKQEDSWLGFLFNNNINCDKCLQYSEVMKGIYGRRNFIRRRDELLNKLNIVKE